MLKTNILTLLLTPYLVFILCAHSSLTLQLMPFFQGAIPIQISGLNTLPISAVKSIPMPVNLSTLTPTSAPVLTTATINQVVWLILLMLSLVLIFRIFFKVVAAKKTKVDLVSSLPSRVTTSVPTNTTASVVNKVNNNNKTGGHKATGGSFSGKVNSKTCSWVFENGEMCGKTFSKSYNLVVHMRMHEDVRPFQVYPIEFQKYVQISNNNRHFLYSAACAIKPSGRRHIYSAMRPLTVQGLGCQMAQGW